MSSDSSKDLLVAILKDAKILSLFFNENAHAQFIKRIDGLLKLLMNQNALSRDEKQWIWEFCQEDEEMRLGLYTTLEAASFGVKPG